MRYKIKAPDLASYHDLLLLLTERVPIYVASEKRRFLSTGELPGDVRDEVASRGGEVTLEFQYEPENVAGS